MRKLLALFAGIGLGVAGTALYQAGPWAGQARAAADPYRSMSAFGEIYQHVLTDYVEVPDEAKLLDAAINGMVSSLDPHSNYYDAKGFQEFQSETKGEFAGLGLEVAMEGDAVKVVTPIDDSPAAKAGMVGGDLIVAIDGEPVKGMSIDQAVNKMRGAAGSAITLAVKRAGTPEPISVKIVRAVIRVQSVKAKVEGGDVGYIRITQFDERAASGLTQALSTLGRSLRPERAKGYILDLRNNPGGLLDQSIDVASVFQPRGTVVSVRGRAAGDTQTFKASGTDLIEGKPLIVLVNGGSASASEIVAGALQDHRRATILGTRSFGKGSVQSVIPLPGNGALKLTTARYYTPSGRSIQAKGIHPDIEILENVPPALKGLDETKGEAGLSGHLKGPDDKEEGGSSAYVPLDEKDDTQLKAALALLRGERKSPFFPPDMKRAAAN